MKTHVRRSNLKQKRKSGFRKRNSTKKGKKIIARRRRRGRNPTSV